MVKYQHQHQSLSNHHMRSALGFCFLCFFWLWESLETVSWQKHLLASTKHLQIRTGQKRSQFHHCCTCFQLHKWLHKKNNRQTKIRLSPKEVQIKRKCGIFTVMWLRKLKLRHCTSSLKAEMINFTQRTHFKRFLISFLRLDSVTEDFSRWHALFILGFCRDLKKEN